MVERSTCGPKPPSFLPHMTCRGRRIFPVVQKGSQMPFGSILDCPTKCKRNDQIFIRYPVENDLWLSPLQVALEPPPITSQLQPNTNTYFVPPFLSTKICKAFRGFCSCLWRYAVACPQNWCLFFEMKQQQTPKQTWKRKWCATKNDSYPCNEFSF